MVVFERKMSILRYRKVFFPNAEQLADLLKSLRTLDVLRVFRSPTISSNGIRPLAESVTGTTFVGLRRDPEAIFAGMRTNCRYDVRRAEKMRDRFEIAMNTEAVLADFPFFFNRFARTKGKIPLLKPSRFREYLPHADVFMLYFDGQPTCGRLVLRDKESRTALMLYSATRRLEPGVDTAIIGSLNRYLHWHEMKTYQAAGMEIYDFGGTGPNSSVVNFKLSFGGETSSNKTCVYAGAAPSAWKLAHSLYVRWTGEPA